MKIPTAEEFIRNEWDNYTDQLEGIVEDGNHAAFMMREFAKLHVQACKEEIAQKIKYYPDYTENSKINDAREKASKESILSTYPSELIK
jgi:hypothetical protein